jgi:hypothetical protein
VCAKVSLACFTGATLSLRSRTKRAKNEHKKTGISPLRKVLRNAGGIPK